MTSLTFKIKGQEINIAEKEPNIYEGNLGKIKFKIKKINFGEKNTILDLSTKFHEPSQKYYTDNITYNENMMKASILSIELEEKKIDINELDAEIGDHLLDLSLELNKKTSTTKEKYELTPENNQFNLKNKNIKATLKKWTWGEKMQVVKNASIYNPKTEEMQLLNGRFSELLLNSTLTSLNIEEKEIPIKIENIRNLPVDIGEFLVAISININTLSSEQKKT